MNEKILKYLETGDWQLVVRKSNDANWLFYAEIWKAGRDFAGDPPYEGCGESPQQALDILATYL